MQWKVPKTSKVLVIHGDSNDIHMILIYIYIECAKTPVAVPRLAKEVVVNPMGVLDMGVNVMSVRDSWKQHHHSLEAGERWGGESGFTYL